MSSTLLVTGGAGFIGSALIRLLLRESEYRIVNVDKLTYAASVEALEDADRHPRYRFEQIDICDAEALARVFAAHKPDGVLHLAAESHVDRSIDGPADFIQTNILGSFRLLEATLAHWQSLDAGGRSRFRFHHISTDEVYGSLGDSGLFVETTPYAPHSPYSASKASSDHLVRAWHHTFGLPVVITNCSNNYGPYQFPEKLVPLMILNALEFRPLPVYGTGANVRDWLYVEDHARALRRVFEQGRIGEQYNIGGHNEQRNLDLVEQLCALIDALRPDAAGRRRRELIRFVEDRKGHDLRYAIDAGKIGRELGWQPQETFDTGLRKTVEWYLANRGWCEAVQARGYQRQRLGLGKRGMRAAS